MPTTGARRAGDV